ncbi:MAG: O-antigen ligase family protein [Oscillospiraceae bacterium]|nr:O-antigen ligase family protein [Oscillospiraceae bacterium]
MFLNRARWVTDKYILVMLGLFPLFVGFRLRAYTAITEAKLYFFLAATGLWLLAVLVLLAAGAARGERYHPRIRPVHIALGLFLAAGAVSAAVSEYGSLCLMGAERYDGFVMTVLYSAVFFGVSLLGAPRRRYAWAMGFSSGICSVIAALQLLGFDPLWLYPQGLNYYDKYEALNAAYLGTIGNTGLLAAYLCLAAPLLVVFALLSDRWQDTFLLLPGILDLVILVLCDVDAGLVALAGCLLVTPPVVLRRKRAAVTAACVSGGAAAAGLAAVYFWPGRSGTLWEFSQVLHGHLSDEFGSHRGQIWKRGIALFLEKPWLGSGPGTAGKRFHIQWSRYIEILGRERVVSVGNAHNVYLGYLINIGVFGLLGYLAAAASSLITWFRRRHMGALYPALGSAFLCYMIQDFFGIGLCLTAPMLWVIWGLLESGGETARPAGPNTESE